MRVLLSPRRLWRLVPIASVALCSVFAAQALDNVIAYEVFPDRERAAPAPMTIPAPSGPAPVVRSKDGEPLIVRNIFCHDCEPGGPPPTSPSSRTREPLRLIATHLSARGDHSFASVLNTSSQRQGAYGIGDTIPGAGVVHSIGSDYLEFRRQDRSVERIDFDDDRLESRPQSRAASARGGGSKGQNLAAELVREVADNHFEVDRKLIATLRGNPLLAGARIRPIRRDGKMAGVRLFAVRSSGLAHAMGLRNGDTITAANGLPLNSMEAGLELMGQLQQRDHWSIDLLRRGKPVELKVDFQ